MSPSSSSLPHFANFDMPSRSESRYKNATQYRADVQRCSAVTVESRGLASMALTVALSAGDDKHAIEILWKLYRDDILRYCRRMLGNDAEAADVTQKVFENAIMGLGHLRSVDSASWWLVGIARHRCLDHARSVRRAPQLVDVNALCQIAAASLTAEPVDEDPRAVKLLGECLEHLDACDRALIELRYYEGLPFKDIARQLGKTPVALRVRLTRACRLLRRYLKVKLARFDPSNGQPHRCPDSAERFS